MMKNPTDNSSEPEGGRNLKKNYLGSLINYFILQVLEPPNPYVFTIPAFKIGEHFPLVSFLFFPHIIDVPFSDDILILLLRDTSEPIFSSINYSLLFRYP